MGKRLFENKADNRAFNRISELRRSEFKAEKVKAKKVASDLLKKFPNHGEIEAAKSLVLLDLGERKEAAALSKLAILHCPQSSACWHAFAQASRANRNHDAAMKAYKCSVDRKIKEDPPEKYRLTDPTDSARLSAVALQKGYASYLAQKRDYRGLVDARLWIKDHDPTSSYSWVGLAIARHLAGNLAGAENILTQREEIFKPPIGLFNIENSELLLYKNSIIAESGDLERALEHLNTACKNCLDVLAVMEMRADYLLRLDRKDEAAAAYEALLERNAENSHYYDALIKAKGIDESDHKTLKSFFDEWVEKFPRGDSARRIPLEFLEGEDFRNTADSYLQRMLRKGIPSTFVNIKTLYSNTAKRDVIQELAEGYASGKVASQENGSTGNQTNGDNSTFESSIFYFLAQHYDYRLSRNLEKATEYVDKAIALSPNSVDYNMTKARIYKHYGDFPKAAEQMEKARSLDEKDRHINSKAAKYQLRNGENEKALATMSKFTRNEAVGGTLGDLHDIQCVWYLTEDGESYLRQRKLGLALKRFHAISDIFNIWYEDQLDFHNFSIQRSMIRAYIDVFRWEGHIRDQPFFIRAATGAIKAYILLHDEPDLKLGAIPAGMNGTGDEDGADSAERRKALNKARREQKRREKAEADARALKKASSTSGGNAKAEDEDLDPVGDNLVKTKTPLEDATKFLEPLLTFSPGNIDAQVLGFEVHIRRQKYLLALKCLLAAHAIDSTHPEVHSQMARFRQTIDTLTEPLPAEVSEVIATDFEPLLSKSENLTSWNDSFLAAHKSSAAHVQSALSVRRLLTPDAKAGTEKDLLSTVDLETTSLENALAGLHLLDDWKSSREAKAAYINQAQKRWEQASAFRAQ
ncbi:hypothetical protein FQN55_002873 [Onygenales sp. PD_40]|nr:hypothetical protein FQN55_002873 [Onygenales sp. PD_40]KAK2791143.1 hypothetical protein FQN52_005099 [Onygenales sp. PD_12]KAK2799629.1 hypothetical protein FQN51_006761 [Onygenales sp. PD_10]